MSKTISCPNCGAKYKVPEDTKASRAKCKACGTVIDIQGQLHAAPVAPLPTAKSSKKTSTPPAPQKAKPAGKPKEKDVELPVSARKKNPSREGIRRAASKPSRSSRKRTRGDEEEGETPKRGGRGRGSRATAGRSRGRGARGHRENTPEDKSKTPMYLGIGGGVVAIAIAAFFLFKSPAKEPAPKQDQNKVASNDGQEKPAQNKVASNEGKKEKTPANAVAAAGKEGGNKTAEASSPKNSTPKKPAKKTKAKKKKKKFVYGESSTPFDAKSLDPVPFTDDTTEEEKADMKRWTKKIMEDSGFPGTKALRKIIKMGRKGVPALINALRELDYTTEEGTVTAQLINDGLSQVFLGLNAGFNVVQGKPKEEVTWWNAKCVRTWVRQWEAKGSGDPEEWDRFIQARKKKMK
jgi:hypothetical protein